MYGVDEEYAKHIAKDKITTHMEELYGWWEEVEKELLLRYMTS